MLLIILFVLIIFSISVFSANENSISQISSDVLIPRLDVVTQTISLSDSKEVDQEIIVTALKNNSLVITSAPIISSKSLYLNDTTDYLKNIPGFSFIRNGGTNNDPIFRGMMGSQIRILVDNGELLGACFNRMDPASSYFSSDTFDILNIIKGPQTVIWGPPVSGVILQFQRYHPDFRKSMVQLRSNITVGSNNSVNKSIDSVLGYSRGYIRLIGNSGSSDDYRDGNNDRVHSAWNKWNVDAILSYDIGIDTSIQISLGQGNGCASYAFKSMDGLCFAKESYGFKLETIDINHLFHKVELQAWHHNIHHLMANNTYLSFSKRRPCSVIYCCSTDKKGINYVDRCLWGIRSITTYQWMNMQFYSGIDLQINKHKKNANQDDNNCQINIDYKNSGIFTEFIYDIFLNKKIVGGTRVEYYTVMNTDNNYSQYHRYKSIYPVGFVRYENNIHPSFLYYIGIGTSYRFPDYWELISKNLIINQKKMDKIFQLKPEKTIQMDFGINFQKSKIDGWISSYAGYIKDFIFYNESSNLNRIHDNTIDYYIKNVPVKVCGSEMGLVYKFNEYWHGEGNMSWAWGRNIDNNCVLPTIPPIEGALICKFQQKNYNLGITWRLVSSSQSTKKVFPCICINDFLSKNYIDIPGFGVLSIYTELKILKHYTCSIGINNLLNKSYKEYVSNSLRDYGHSDYTKKALAYEPGRIWWIKIETRL